MDGRVSFDTFVVYAQTNVFLKGRGDETDTTLNTFLRDKWDLLLVPTCVGILHVGGGIISCFIILFFQGYVENITDNFEIQPNFRQTCVNISSVLNNSDVLHLISWVIKCIGTFIKCIKNIRAKKLDHTKWSELDL